MKLHRFLDRYLDTYQWHLRNRRRAAKKARVRQKWYNRFGGGLTEELMRPREEWFLTKIARDHKAYDGGTLIIPFQLNSKGGLDIGG